MATTFDLRPPLKQVVALVFLIILLIVTSANASVNGLGDFSYFLPYKSSASALDAVAPPRRHSTRTSSSRSSSSVRRTKASVVEEPSSDGSIEETRTFSVPLDLPQDIYNDLVSKNNARLLRHRLEAESVRVKARAKGGGYKLWLSRDVIVISLKVLPVGFRTFILQALERDADADEESPSVVFSVSDLGQSMDTSVSASAECFATIETVIKFGATIPSARVSLRCSSRNINKQYRARILLALEEAWTDRLREDLELTAVRIRSAHQNQQLTKEALSKQKKVDIDKILNPRKPISPTVRRPGSGGRLNLGDGRRKQNLQRTVVKRGG